MPSKQAYLARDVTPRIIMYGKPAQRVTLADLFHLPYGSLIAKGRLNIRDVPRVLTRFFSSLEIGACPAHVVLEATRCKLNHPSILHTQRL
ncbi:hypothetical protein JB92DRAFT_2944067 [Gautieria morchelliformis]|nr:hypothetical protein JB92DRAFT_2944067 [Gautieria morchelliformis]